MDDLVVWLRQQLDEDERLARALAPGIWAVDYPGSGNYPLIFDTERGTLVDDDHGLDASVAEHIALHDPARVLRDVARDRLILDDHAGPADSPYVADYCEADGWCRNPNDEDLRERMPCRYVRLLALPYSDRPGYREEWKQL